MLLSYLGDVFKQNQGNPFIVRKTILFDSLNKWLRFNLGGLKKIGHA